jgi:hypothetical protein
MKHFTFSYDRDLDRSPFTRRSATLQPNSTFIPFLGLLILGCLCSIAVQGQGCVALRSLGQSGGIDVNQPNVVHQSWELNTDFRYFNSFRHYVGTQQQFQRLQLQNNVINYAYNFDLALTYGLTDRWSFTADVPIIIFMRSQLIKGTATREQTHSHGIGDARISSYYWLFNPKTHFHGNLQAGLGVKLPTGNYDVKDYFYSLQSNNTLTRTLKPVDESIQPGDGGFGISVELNGFQRISNTLYGYENFFYLINPRETNGVTSGQSNPFAAVNSVTDQYMERAGFTRFFPSIHGLSASLGARLECIPVYDLIGGSAGFRRPGYVFSGEPGLGYMAGKSEFSLSVPIAIIRNRTQSVPDKELQASTKTAQHGDAAFADYEVSLSYAFRF